MASAAFAGGPDHAGSVVNEAGEVVIFQVVDTAAPATPLEAAAIDSLDAEARSDLQSEFVAAVRDDAGLRVNQQALNQLLVQNFGQ